MYIFEILMLHQFWYGILKNFCIDSRQYLKDQINMSENNFINPTIFFLLKDNAMNS